jgi:ADP-heptose:LPS heptosyltransferase
LRAARFDLVVDLQGLLRSGVMAWLSGAPRRLGLADAREGGRWFYTDIADAPNWKDLHAVERNWQAARILGAGDQPLLFRVPLHDDALNWARATLADLPRPWLCFGMGATRPTKRWPAAHFAALADRAQEQFGGTVVFVGRGEDTPQGRHVLQARQGPALDLTGKTTLPQLASLLSLADVMIANDTGPLHLAAALGRPVVAPYTCTRIERHGPFGNNARAVASSVWCHGSYRRRCARLDCMSELTPDRLWPALHEVLEAWQQQHQYA